MSTPTANGVIKTGWATKQGGRFKTWKKRWFILEDTGLFRYLDKAGGSEKGNINIMTSTAVSLAPECKKQPAFKIVFPDSGPRTYYIVAENTAETQAWVNILDDVRTGKLKPETEIEPEVVVAPRAFTRSIRGGRRPPSRSSLSSPTDSIENTTETPALSLSQDQSVIAQENTVDTAEQPELHVVSVLKTENTQLDQTPLIDNNIPSEPVSHDLPTHVETQKDDIEPQRIEKQTNSPDLEQAPVPQLRSLSHSSTSSSSSVSEESTDASETDLTDRSVIENESIPLLSYNAKKSFRKSIHIPSDDDDLELPQLEMPPDRKKLYH